MAKNIGKKVLERDILNDICQYLKDENYFFWRSNNIPVFGKNNAGKMTFRSMPRFSMKGVPDIIVITDGRFLGIEVKRPGQELRKEQEVFRAHCIENGGHYYVIHSLEEAQALF